MLAFDRTGSGPPLLLLHGTTSSRAIWAPLLPAWTGRRQVLAIDLPGHGQSPASSLTPPAWAMEVAALLTDQGIDKIDIVGHSAGGWTALELAKLGRARSVLALAPAGLWRKRSPLLTNLTLSANWWLGRVFSPLVPHVLRSPTGRRLGLRSVSARPQEISASVAIDSARTAAATASFPRHFVQTRRLRFEDGSGIAVPLRIVWGERDHIALQAKSRDVTRLPPHTQVETWADCGHMLMWDAPQRVVEAALALAD